LLKGLRRRLESEPRGERFLRTGQHISSQSRRFLIATVLALKTTILALKTAISGTQIKIFQYDSLARPRFTRSAECGRDSGPLSRPYLCLAPGNCAFHQIWYFAQLWKLRFDPSPLAPQSVPGSGSSKKTAGGQSEADRARAGRPACHSS